MRYLLTALLLSTLLIGCAQVAGTPSQEEPTSVATANEYCPIMGGKVTAKGGSTLWNGQSIGFCCPGCIEKWEALPDEEKVTKLASAESHHPEDAHDHADHDHSSMAH